VIIAWCLGLTQHEHGVDTVREIVNVLLLRGNIGREGAGPCPVRGHSNVQGNRTCGVNHRPDSQFLDRLAEVCGIDPPREHGLDVVRAIEAMHDGTVRVFVSLGGNLALAGPDTVYTFEALRNCDLTVHVATKLNRSHIVPGEVTYLLPCLGRIEIDEQAGGPQAVSMEDSTTCIHGSRGQRKPVAELPRSEPAIVAGLAKATLEPNPRVNWDGWVADYSRVRDAIERTYPDQFKDFNRRMFEPGGFPRPLPARERKWKTPNGKANFTVPKSAFSVPAEDNGIYELMTMRADGQFNTTIYNEDDRFRGIRGGRYVVFMNPADMEGEGLKPGDTVTLSTEAGDGVERTLSELQVVAYDIPRRSIAGYYPECNGLIPLWHHAEGSKVPAAKSIPVRISKDAVPEVVEDGQIPVAAAK
jgi:molybdopterin-dependent oxidoreductase alpha subunit